MCWASGAERMSERSLQKGALRSEGNMTAPLPATLPLQSGTHMLCLEYQKNTSEQIICQAMLFLICFKTSCNPSFFGLPVLFNQLFSFVASSIRYSLLATTLICTVLGILCWSIFKWDVLSVSISKKKQNNIINKPYINILADVNDGWKLMEKFIILCFIEFYFVENIK